MAKIEVAITKGKATVSFESDDLPEHIYAAALALGLKELANKGMSKITKETYPVPEELRAAAMAKAEENVIAINAGTIKLPGAKAAASKVSGAIMTEARRIARNMVKDAIKANGGKVSHVEAKDITAAANLLLAEDPSIIELATANLADRAKVPVSAAILSAIPISEKKVKQAEAKKAKDQLSAKQAGKVATRKKGAANQVNA